MEGISYIKNNLYINICTKNTNIVNIKLNCLSKHDLKSL